MYYCLGRPLPSDGVVTLERMNEEFCQNEMRCVGGGGEGSNLVITEHQRRDETEYKRAGSFWRQPKIQLHKDLRVVGGHGGVRDEQDDQVALQDCSRTLCRTLKTRTTPMHTPIACGLTMVMAVAARVIVKYENSIIFMVECRICASLSVPPRPFNGHDDATIKSQKHTLSIPRSSCFKVMKETKLQPKGRSSSHATSIVLGHIALY